MQRLICIRDAEGHTPLQKISIGKGWIVVALLPLLLRIHHLAVTCWKMHQSGSSERGENPWLLTCCGTVLPRLRGLLLPHLVHSLQWHSNNTVTTTSFMLLLSFPFHSGCWLMVLWLQGFRQDQMIASHTFWWTHGC